MTQKCRDEMSKAMAYELSEDTPTNPLQTPTFGDIVNIRLGRRETLKGMLAVTALSATGFASLLTTTSGEALAAATTFKFDEISARSDETHHVAPGYDAEVLIRWGDPVLPGAPAFDPMNQTAEAQGKQFGYNCDFIGYLPLPHGSGNPDRALLFVNHEYTNEELMFPGLGRQNEQDFADMSRSLVDIEMAAHGASVIEIVKRAGTWRVTGDSRYNRRISALSTGMRISGPAAGHARMKTSDDPNGTHVIGMFANCAGGQTP